MSSKDRFIEVALDLFSQYGFEGVSVRDISNLMGMRESALYKHFENKAQIFEKIIERASELLNRFQSQFVLEGKSTREITIELMCGVFDLYTQNSFMNKFRKLMIISQYQNSVSKSRYQEMFIEKSLHYYESIFTRICEDIKMEDINPKLMAYEIYSILFLLMQEFDSDNNLSKMEEAKKILKEHIAVFFSRHKFLEE